MDLRSGTLLTAEMLVRWAFFGRVPSAWHREPIDGKQAYCYHSISVHALSGVVIGRVLCEEKPSAQVSWR